MTVATSSGAGGHSPHGREVLDVPTPRVSVPDEKTPPGSASLSRGDAGDQDDIGRPRLQDRLASIDPWDDYTAVEKLRWYAFDRWRELTWRDVADAGIWIGASAWSFFIARVARDALVSGALWPILLMVAPWPWLVIRRGRRHP